MKDDDKRRKSRSWLARLITLLHREPKNKEQLMMVLRDAEERHLFSAEMLGMIERILQVSEMQVREVMIPKTQMVTVTKNSKLENLLPIVLESGHSRFPVMDASGKDVIGMLLAKEVSYFFFHAQDNKEFTLNTIIRPAMFTPHSKRLDILLREFRVNRNHIAIVLDEYGHVAGLITIEDVLEQIVGDIEDEYDIDEEESHIKKLDDGSYIVKATTFIEEFNGHFHTTFDSKEFSTVGEMVLKHFDYLPRRGETIKLDHFRFKILHSDHRRLYLLEVKKLKAKKK